MEIHIETEFEPLRDYLQALAQRKLPNAYRRTVNDLAFAVRAKTYDEMRALFDRPTPFTLRSIEVEKAATKIAPSSWVGLRHNPDYQRALAHEMTGNNRAWKKFEGKLLSMGLLPAGYAAVPSNAGTFDSYGNLPVTIIRRILKHDWRSSLTTRGLSTGMKTQRTAARAQALYFVVPIGNAQKLQPGIYQRFRFAAGSSIKPVLVYVRKGHYRRLIDIQRIGERTLATDGTRLLAINLANALAGAIGDDL